MWDNNTPKHVPTHTRKKILARDNHTCQHCGTTTPPLEVDHIDNTRSPNYNKETNLQTLCRPCHNKKTQQEAAIARKLKAQRKQLPTKPHPGTITTHPG